MTERRIINEASCYLTLSKAREKRGAQEKGEQLPTLVFLVKVVSLWISSRAMERERRGRAIERKKGANKVTRWET